MLNMQQLCNTYKSKKKKQTPLYFIMHFKDVKD